MNINRTILIGITLVLTALMAACAGVAQNSPAAQDSPLTGSEWVLESLNGKTPIEGKAITLRFGDAAIEGSGGCNTYGGSYTASEENLSLSDLYWTEIGCPEPAGILEQEQAYFEALNGAARYRMEGDRLELYDEGGAQSLVYGPQKAALTATIEAPESLSTGAEVKVKFTLTNASSEGLFVLTWFTPLEGLAADTFSVQRDAEELPYQGKMVKRAAPTSDDYVWIEARGSTSTEVDLAEGYDFAQAGQYSLQFRSPRLSHTAKTLEEQASSVDELSEIRIPSNTVSVTIGGP
jgi:heat shock protein HslJ